MIWTIYLPVIPGVTTKLVSVRYTWRSKVNPFTVSFIWQPDHQERT